jgi:hypothetical protein
MKETTIVSVGGGVRREDRRRFACPSSFDLNALYINITIFLFSRTPAPLLSGSSALLDSLCYAQLH